jgi:hypothetical protein
MQFRVMVDAPMLNFDWTSVSGEGWKVFIAFGPIPGPSCTGDQFVQENTYQRNILFGYTSCGSPALVTNNGATPYNFQQGDYTCPYGTNLATDPTCSRYEANQWLTEYWKVTTGTFGQPNTHFEAWAGYPGQPLTKFIDLPNFKFGNPSSPTDAIEEVILQPYFSQASASTITPGATMWFDELIISTQAIAVPIQNNGVLQ